jgi:hypothetical protein
MLWRDRTERFDGLGHNVVLSHYRRSIVDDFLAAPDTHRRDPIDPDVAPSAQILDVLLEESDI